MKIENLHHECFNLIIVTIIGLFTDKFREEARKLVPFVAARREPETRETIPLRKLEIEADKKSFDPFLRYLLNIIDKEGERLEQYMESSSLDASILPKDLQQWRVYIEHKAPCWAILAVVDLATVLEILESLSSWLEKDAIDLQVGNKDLMLLCWYIFVDSKIC